MADRPFASYQFDPATYDTPRETMSAYEPTVRDRIGGAIAGERPTDLRRRIASELVGSSGLGRTGMNALDAAPYAAAAAALPIAGPAAAMGAGAMAGLPSDALLAQEAYQHNDPMAAAYAGSLAMPLAGKLAQFIGRGVRAAPKLAAGALGSLGSLLVSEAHGGEMSPEQQLKLRLQRQSGQQDMKLKADAERARLENQGAAAAQERALQAERQRASDAAAAQYREREQGFELENRRKDLLRQSEASQRQFEYEQSQRPFSERHPDLTAALPIAGMAGAAISPYLMRMAKQLYQNGVIREWRDAIPAAEKLLKATADKSKRSAALTELQNYGQSISHETPSAGRTGTALSAMLPGELNVLPTIMDAATLDPGQPARERARMELMDPREWASRVPLGLAGATFAGLGNKLPLAMTREIPPAARTAGLTAAFSNMPKRAAAPKRVPAGLPDAPSPISDRPATRSPQPGRQTPPPASEGESWSPPADIPQFLPRRDPAPTFVPDASGRAVRPSAGLEEWMAGQARAPQHFNGQRIEPGRDGMYRYQDGRAVLPNVDFGPMH